METLKQQVERFLSVSYGSGYGYGSGSGDGYDSGYGYGSGSGDGYGDGSGDGDGYGYGSGSGDGYGDGSGDGDGDGSGYGDGDGSGDGYGYGSGYGSGDGDGSGYGDGDGSGDGYGYGYGSGSGDGYGDGSGISSFNGEKVHKIDDVNTIIRSIHGDVAQGYILNRDLTTTPCYVVKEEDVFAHGATLHEAHAALQEKLFEELSPEQRVEKFKETFPDFTAKIDAMVLFDWHHKLTGSCEMGRRQFARDHDIDLDHDKFTVLEFIKLTENSYGGGTIKMLRQ
jgi:hypothetical protein